MLYNIMLQVSGQEMMIQTLKSQLNAMETYKYKADRELMLHKLKSASLSLSDGVYLVVVFS